MITSTAVFECFTPLFAVAWAGFVGSDCRRAIYKRQKMQYFLTFLLLLLSVQTKHILKWQYEKHFFVLVLSFFVSLTVPTLKSKLWTVGTVRSQQFKRDKCCFLLSALQSYIRKAVYGLSAKITANSTYVIILAYDCRHDSRKLKRQDMNCRPKITTDNRNPIKPKAGLPHTAAALLLILCLLSV